MTLKDWLDSNQFTDAAFARLLSELLGKQVKPQSVFQYKRGTMPAWDVGDAINRLTSGRVKPDGFA